MSGVARAADRLRHVAHERFQLRFAERQTAGRRRRTGMAGKAGHELQRQVLRFQGIRHGIVRPDGRLFG
jgi:hypothetical protein